MTLELDPVINQETQVSQFDFPVLDSLENFSDIFVAHACAYNHGVVFELGDYVLDLFDNKAVFGITVLEDTECYVLPVVDDFLQGVYDVLLATGSGRNGFDILNVQVSTVGLSNQNVKANTLMHITVNLLYVNLLENVTPVIL